MTKLASRKTTLHAPSRAATALRATVLAAAAMVLAWPLTTTPGVAAAALGSLCGVLAAQRAAASRLRLQGGLGLAVLGLFFGLLLCSALLGSAFIARTFGPVNTLWLGEILRWLGLTLPTIFALRLAAERRPLLAVLEVVLVAMAMASGFSAHRDGAVHRPLSIGDWAWTRGFDPAYLFLLLGGLGTLLLAALLLSESRRRRLPLHLASLVLVALFLLFFVRVEGLPKPQPAGDLGLTGDPSDEEEQGGGKGGEGQSERKQDKNDQMDDLEFKDEYSSQGSQAPVAVALLHDDYSPPSGVYYFRQTVFSQFNGRRLVQTSESTIDRDVLQRFPYAETQIPDAPPVSDQRSELRTSMGLLIDHVKPFALDSPAVIRPMENPNPLRFQRAFEVVSHVQTLPYDDMIGEAPGDPDWDEATWDLYTEAPGDPRYGELSTQLMDWLRPEYLHDPLAQSLAIKSYLDQNGIYSRKSKHASSEDPAASFLFGDLTGYCVHFAHAATYLYRSRGIPARVAAGYAVSEASRGGGSAVVIRGADAHAWPEIYLEGVGWVVVDLTPQQSLEEPEEQTDPELQRMLGEMMRQQPWNQDGLQNREPFDPMKLLYALLAFLGAVLLTAHVVKLWRRLAPRLAPPEERYRVAYRAALDRLADVGHRRRFGESRELFAQRLAERVPSLPRLTAAHLGAALGSRSAGDAPWLEWEQELRRELAEDTPRWRRILGELDPFSWIRVR